MRPGCPFYCALLLDSELDPNLNCFWPPPRGLEPDQPWTSFLTWKTLLDSIFSNPCTTHGHKHGCHVLITTHGCWIPPPCGHLPGLQHATTSSPLIFLSMMQHRRRWRGERQRRPPPPPAPHLPTTSSHRSVLRPPFLDLLCLPVPLLLTAP
jgi:hypothetical protein